MRGMSLISRRHLVSALIAMPSVRSSLVALSLTASLAAALAQTTLTKAEAPRLKVGDQWRFEQRDRLTGNKDSEVLRVVTAVTDSHIEGTENAGTFRMTPDLTVVDSPTNTNSDSAKFLNFPLEVGKKWAFKSQWTNKTAGTKGRQQLEMSVVSYERLKVLAGEFDTFKIEAKGFWNNDSSGGSGRTTMVYWFAPAARSVVKTEYDDGYNRWIRELAELKLQP